jgi:para-nitrobenzyl esterase
MHPPRSARRRAVLLVLATSLGLIPVASAGPAAADTRSGAVVRTDNGAVRGTVGTDGRAFRHIPFAAPPVGALRWRAPQPAAAWPGVREATAPGPTCAQDGFPLLSQPRVTSEDCLYLNVHTPPGRTGNRPVMVYIHGGAYANGSGNGFDGGALARHGAVVVTVNYRLGAFGFLAHPALTAEDPQAKSGNYGLLDQLAALRWVQANAAAFGGDPRRVTVFGSSSGGESVCALLASPRAAWLFSRAIVQSGPCHLVAGPLFYYESIGTSFASAAACGAAADVAACLRALPPAAILDAVRTTPGLAGPNQVWAPAIGTPVLPVKPNDAIAAGSYHRVPVMIGTVRDEGTVLTMVALGGRPVDAATYAALMAGWFGGKVPLVEAQYPLASYGGNHGATVSAILGDWLVTCPDAGLRRSLAATTRTYAYEFSDRTAPNLYSVAPDYPLGAYHAAELAYLAPSPDLPLSAGQRRLSEQLLRYWVAFAAGGNPNGPDSPRWARFTADRPIVQTLDVDAVAGGSDFEARHRCGFWADLLS